MSTTASHLVANDPTQVIVGAEVIMTQQDGAITLYTSHADGPELLGRFAGAADAWSALDELDAPFTSEVLTAA